MDQTNHIQTKILASWFNHGHLPKLTNTPFSTDQTFEVDLSQSPPLEASDLKLYKSRLYGPFNHTFGNLLHIQQWTQEDINFVVIHILLPSLEI